MCTKCNNTGTFKKRAKHNPFMPLYNQDEFDYFSCNCEIGIAKRIAKRDAEQAEQAARDKELEELHAEEQREEEQRAREEEQRAIEMLSDKSLNAVKVVLKKEKTAYTPYGMQDTFLGDNGKKYRTIKFNLPEGVPLVIVANRGFVKDVAILSSFS